VKRRIAIVGGGVAGIAAAVRVADAGGTPVVIETRKKLGGRATSFSDPRSGRTLDNCQHVLMGCCTNLIDLYERLGVLESIEWHKTTYWANPPSEPDEFTPSRMPAPAHFARAFRRMKLLDRADKRGVARAMWRMIRMGRRGRLAARGTTFSDFLKSTEQTPAALERFWEPIIVSACNASSATCDASYAIQVLQEGFLGNAWSAAVGVPTTPLVDLYDAAQSIIEKEGGELRLGESAKAIGFDGARVTGVITDEGMVDSAAVISAVPADRLEKLCSATLKKSDQRLKHLDALKPSPILGVHLFFDADVMDTPHLVLPGRATQWLFNKGRDENGLHHVHAVISAAHDWMDLDEPEIARRVLVDVQWALPRAKGLEPVEVRSVKEKRATFAVEPGVDEFRPTSAPDARGGVSNLFLAGDWTATGWPATMEGAARSGYAAAAACMGSGGLVPDVPTAMFARWLGLR
jgi:zeta-carotene desaturase